MDVESKKKILEVSIKYYKKCLDRYDEDDKLCINILNKLKMDEEELEKLKDARPDLFI